jgi:hypothetical protein
MSLARLVVTAVRGRGPIQERGGPRVWVSRRWVHELVTRFDAKGEAGMVPRSRGRGYRPSGFKTAVVPTIQLLPTDAALGSFASTRPGEGIGVSGRQGA